MGENRRSFDADGLRVSETEYRRRVFEGWHAHLNFHLRLTARRKPSDYVSGTDSVLELALQNLRVK